MIDRMAFKGQASTFHLFDLVKGQDIFFFLLGKVRDDIIGGGHLVLLKKRIDDSIEIFDAIIKGQRFIIGVITAGRFLWVLRS